MPVEFRYLRWSTSGSTNNEGTHFVEIKIFTNDGTNIITPATPITIVTSNKNASPDHPLSTVSDGSIDSDQYFTTDPDGSTTIEVDLGTIIDSLTSVKFWHYYLDDRTYYNVELMVSKDRIRWQRIYGPTDTLATAEGTEIVLETLDPNLPSYVIPLSYSYSVEPGYPDTGMIELIDGVIAGRYWPDGGPAFFPPWVGWGDEGRNPIITFSFPLSVAISKVSIHFQGDHDGSIYLPSSLNIEQSHYDIGDLNVNGWQEFNGHWEGSTMTLNFTNLPQSVIFISEVMFTEAQSTASLKPPTVSPTVSPSTGSKR